MPKAKVIFYFDGADYEIQCKKEDLFKDICQKFANKIQKNINSFIFLYNGNILNFQLKFKDQANLTDKKRNEMKVLVYKKEDGEYMCPKCGEKIKLNKEKIKDIESSINNLNEKINGVKLLIESIIKSSSNNSVNIQLKSVNLILNTLDEDIKKLNKNLKNMVDDNLTKINQSNKIGEKQNNNINNNFIIAEINVNDNIVNKYVRILNSYEEYIRTNNYEQNEECNNEEEIKNCEIKINDKLIPFNYFYNFKSKGNYIIKYTFKNAIL